MTPRLTRILVLLLLSLTSLTQAVPPTQPQIDAARNKGLAWLITHQSGEGNWTSRPGTEVITTSLALAAFEKAGVKGPTYSKGVGWVANAKASSTDARARQAIALNNAGMNASGYVSRLIAMQNTTASWGAYAGFAGSFPDTPLVLDAVKITGATLANLTTSVGFLTGKQNADGGWPFNASEIAAPQSRVVPTAAAVATLVRYRTTITTVDPNINNGIAWLKGKQNLSTGAIGDTSTGTIYETAMAYQAIVAMLGTADVAAGNALGYLVSQQSADGSWGGDPLSTALALASLPSPTAALTDIDGDGIPDAVEAFTGTNGTVADGRTLTLGNGNSVRGVTFANGVGSGALNSAFNTQLTASGGTATYQWTLTAGKLPPCVTLTWNGILSGTLTTPGTYNFSYQVTDS